MGLSLSVGYLADVAEGDPEGAESVRESFAALNAFLRSRGMAEHREPENIRPFSCDMYGYGGLHYLRRVAAHLAANKTLPPPGDQNASKDPVLATRYAAGQPRTPGLFQRWLGRVESSPLKFEHIINHSDAEGYYLPRDFTDVLICSKEFKIPGMLIGSSVRLLSECKELAAVLELPLTIDPESDEVWSAPEAQGKGETKWKRYGVESFTCLRLHAAAMHSLETGAALVFC
jgi:hypothetical protein